MPGLSFYILIDKHFIVSFGSHALCTMFILSNYMTTLFIILLKFFFLLQGFSGMNRFSQSTWSKVQCEMILAFLSFAEYFRPRFFLLENVRNFVSFNKGQTFRLTLASLLEMGYQVSINTHHHKITAIFFSWFQS